MTGQPCAQIACVLAPSMTLEHVQHLPLKGRSSSCTHSRRNRNRHKPYMQGRRLLYVLQGVVVAPVWQVARQHAVSSLQQQPLCDNFFDPYPDGFQAAYRAGRVLEYVSAGA